jgi:hypothetical protein
MPHPKNPSGNGYGKPQQLKFPWREESSARDASSYFVANPSEHDQELCWQDQSQNRVPTASGPITLGRCFPAVARPLKVVGVPKHRARTLASS